MASCRIPFIMPYERFPVIGSKHPLGVRFFIEYLAAQLVVGDKSKRVSGIKQWVGSFVEAFGSDWRSS